MTAIDVGNAVGTTSKSSNHVSDVFGGENSDVRDCARQFFGYRNKWRLGTRTRLDGVLSGKVRRDGANSTDALIALVAGSKFREHVRAVLA